MPARVPIHIDEKIGARLAVRGWTEEEVRDAAALPPIGVSTDSTGARSDPATVYGSREPGYVVVNNATGRVLS